MYVAVDDHSLGLVLRSQYVHLVGYIVVLDRRPFRIRLEEW